MRAAAALPLTSLHPARADTLANDIDKKAEQFIIQIIHAELSNTDVALAAHLAHLLLVLQSFPFELVSSDALLLLLPAPLLVQALASVEILPLLFQNLDVRVERGLEARLSFDALLLVLLCLHRNRLCLKTQPGHSQRAADNNQALPSWERVYTVQYLSCSRGCTARSSALRTITYPSKPSHVWPRWRGCRLQRLQQDPIRERAP